MDEKLSTVVTDTFVQLYDEGPDLPRQAARQLGPGAASRRCPTSRSRARRATATCGTSSTRSATAAAGATAADAWHAHRDDAARDDARRRRADGASRTTSATSTWSASRSTCRSATARSRSSPTTYVDREFGTGVVKVTGAHDFNDYAVGQRHGLPLIAIFTLDAKINDNAPDARTAASTASTRARRCAPTSRRRACSSKAVPHKLRCRVCARTGQVVEPMLTDQWFVAMTKPGARRQSHRRQGDRGGRERRGALRARAVGQHLQPVDEEHPGLVHLAPALVGPPDPGVVRQRRRDLRRAQRGRGARARPQAAGYAGALTRDEDVLDTWYSSALVPFSTLGWPRADEGAGAVPAVDACSSPASTSSSSGSPG